MNLKPLRYFCEVVEAENANLAAARLHVVPAAVSMQLGQLESLLGGKVFDRSTRPMRLTPLGSFPPESQGGAFRCAATDR